MTLMRIISFGYKNGNVPVKSPGVIVVDVRNLFFNPYRVSHLKSLDGKHPDVQYMIEHAAGFQAKYEFVKQQVMTPGADVAYIGCMGGRHRSVFIAEKLGKELGVPVEHRDL